MHLDDFAIAIQALAVWSGLPLSSFLGGLHAFLVEVSQSLFCTLVQTSILGV